MQLWQSFKNRFTKWWKAVHDPLTKEYLHLSIAMLLIGCVIVIVTIVADKTSYLAIAGVLIGPGLGGLYCHRRDIKEQKRKRDDSNDAD